MFGARSSARYSLSTSFALLTAASIAAASIAAGCGDGSLLGPVEEIEDPGYASPFL